MTRRHDRVQRRIKARRDAGPRFGDADPRREDRRKAERRQENLTGEALEARLRELGITNRRGKPRRSGGERRQ